MLERNHLLILRTVEQCGSLTAAAEILCVTQSALSHTIKKLEQQMGTPIWIKEGRVLRLTEAGEHLLALAQRLLPQFEHAESMLTQIANGQKGILRIGIECHPCYRWLIKIIAPYLEQWPNVDVDVKQEFQFGGIAALFNHDIDIVVTPDPLKQKKLIFTPVFDYELVLAVSKQHAFSKMPYVKPEQLATETLITYPVEIERLDIFNQFLLPAQYRPAKHKIIETTEIILQMVAADRGVAALPLWLLEEYSQTLPIQAVQLGNKGIHKQIFLGTREKDVQTDYIKAFTDLAAH